MNKKYADAVPQGYIRCRRYSELAINREAKEPGRNCRCIFGACHLDRSHTDEAGDPSMDRTLAVRKQQPTSE